MQKIVVFLIMLTTLISCTSGDPTNKEKARLSTVENDSSASIIIKPEAVDENDTLIAKNNSDKDKENFKQAQREFINGTTNYKNGNIEQAIESFKTSLEFFPDNDKAFLNLGNLYYELGQKDLSLSYYKDAVRINPSDSMSLVAIGLIYSERGDTNQAINYYNKAINVAPYFSMVYFNRGTLFGLQKKYQLSIQDLTSAIQYNEQYSEAYVNRGLAYFYTKQMDRACKDWKKAADFGNEKGRKAVDIYCSGKSREKK